MIILKRTKRALALCLAFAFLAAFMSASMAVATEGKVNINSATAKELQQLKGIGKSIAERIVVYREKAGPFAKLEDIKKVKGIGKNTFESIKEKISIEEEELKPMNN